MIRTAVGFLGLLVLLPALRAFDKPETPTPAQQYQALEKEYDKADSEYRNALAKAKAPVGRKKAIPVKNPADKFARRFLDLAEKNPKDPVAVDALAWIVAHVDEVKIDPRNPRNRAMKILLRDHVGSEKMTAVCQALGSFPDESSQQLLRAVLDKSKHRPAQAQASLGLAQQAESRLNLVQQFKDEPATAKRYEAILGRKAVAALVKAGPDKISKEAETLYERTINDFADVPDPDGGTVGEMAKKKLDALRQPITVGKPAPDIDGEDIDGKRFKLSDYRGKVVLLDFWGNW